MGKEGKSLSVSWREQSEPLSLPSVIIYRYFFYRQWASCVQFLCACAKEPRYFPDIGESTDPRTVSSRELHVQLLGKSRGGLPSFADLTRAPRPDPAGDGEQAAALRERCC